MCVDSLAEGDVLGLIRIVLLHHFEQLALDYVHWREAIVAVVIEVQKVASVQRLFDCFVRAVAPVDAVVLVAHTSRVFFRLDHVKVSILVLYSVAALLQVNIVTSGSDCGEDRVELKGLQI